MADGNVLQEFAPVVKRRLKFDQSDWDLVLQSMKEVVHNLTGTAFQMPMGTGSSTSPTRSKSRNIRIGGKTGTAEFGRSGSGHPRDTTTPTPGSLASPLRQTRGGDRRLRRVRRRRFDQRSADCRQGLPRLPRATNARKRGMVLREDSEPVSDQVASPLDDPDAGKLSNEHPGSHAGQDD